MKQHSVLMLSHAFVPAARAGVFRSLRFVEYLPQFGWKSLVVMRSSSASLGGADPSLGRSLPPETVVVQTGVLTPYATACQKANALFSKSNYRKNTSEAERQATPLPEQLEAGDSRLLRIMQSLNRPIERWVATPDQHVGWILPAVKAGLSLIRQHRPLVIFSTGPPHSSHLAAIILKRLTGIPLVLDFRDPWARIEWGETARSHQRVQRRLERFCVGRADCVLLNTPRLRDEFQQFYGDKQSAKFVAISNGYDPGLVDKIESMVATNAPPDSSRTIRICHPGTIYSRRSLKPLVAAIAQVVRAGHGVAFEQVGNVDGNKTELMQYVRDLDIQEHVQISPRLPHEATLRRMATADILAVIQPGTSLQVPGKLYEMLPFRKPILALTEEGATADIVQQFGLGKVANSGDSDAIASAIMDLVANRSAYPDASGWKNAMHAFDGRRLTQDLANVLDELTKSHSSKRPSTLKRSC